MTSEGQIKALAISEDVRPLTKARAETAIIAVAHPFGLQNEQQQRALKLSMSQLAEHDVAPVIARAIRVGE
ncbi:hypothetical protein LJR235_002917 [Pararhizobium sp. LjRoot235]|uniref:hypothetical protein n=1 Tax=Pararhizobium sp. LjRoot235 TaxID=3342291 RepID=UPI003ECFA757